MKCIRAILARIVFSRRSCAGAMKDAVKFASHLPSESSDDNDDDLLSCARGVMASESSDVSSLRKSESEDSFDLTKFPGTSGATALTGPAIALTGADLPPDSNDSGVEGRDLPKDDADGELSGDWHPGQMLDRGLGGHRLKQSRLKSLSPTSI